MALNNAPEVVRELRQQIIATLLARKPRITQREIHAYLSAKGVDGRPRLVNPDTGQPFALGTINKDIKDLRSEYRDKRDAGRDEWVAQLLLSYEEMLSEAWKGKDLELARKVMADIRKLLGLDEPERKEISGPGGGPVETVTKIDVRELSDEELDTLGNIAARLRDADQGTGAA